MRSIPLWLALVLAACGSPDTPAGDECGPGKPSCRTGYTCDPVQGRCILSSQIRDAAPPDAAAAASDASRSPDAPAPAALAIAPTSQTFSAAVGATSAPVDFRVTNGGGVETGPLAAEVSDAVSYSLAGAGCVGTRLAPGASCVVSVRFKPTGDPGPRPATLAVSAEPGARATASLSGTALAPSRLVVTPSAHGFGSVAVGTDSPEQPFRVQNTGGTPTGTLVASITGTSAFRIGSNGCTSTLAAGAECQVGVRFKPTALGAAPAAALEIDGGAGATASATLTGSGIATLTVQKQGTGDGTVTSTPAGIDCGATCSASFTASPVTLTATPGDLTGTIAWSQSGCSGRTCAVTLAAATTVTVTFTLVPAFLSIQPATASFGSVPLNDTATGDPFTVTNNGGQKTGQISASISDPGFDVVGGSCLGTMLPGGNSCTLSVAFTPTGSPGTREATLQVFTDTGENTSAALSGTATCRTAEAPCVEDANCCAQLYCEQSVHQCWSIIF